MLIEKWFVVNRPEKKATKGMMLGKLEILLTRIKRMILERGNPTAMRELKTSLKLKTTERVKMRVKIVRKEEKNSLTI